MQPARATSVRSCSSHQDRPEFDSFYCHYLALVEYALTHGQPVNSVLDGILPIHAAAAGGNEQVLNLIIEHGADVNATVSGSMIPIVSR